MIRIRFRPGSGSKMHQIWIILRSGSGSKFGQVAVRIQVGSASDLNQNPTRSWIKPWLGTWLDLVGKSVTDWRTGDASRAFVSAMLAREVTRTRRGSPAWRRGAYVICMGLQRRRPMKNRRKADEESAGKIFPAAFRLSFAPVGNPLPASPSHIRSQGLTQSQVRFGFRSDADPA